MRKPTPSSSFLLLDDFAAGVFDGDVPLDSSSCPFEGLCIPDDPLDQVLDLVNPVSFTNGFLDSFGADLSPPRETTHAAGFGEDFNTAVVEPLSFGVGGGEDDAGSKSAAAAAAAEDMEAEPLDVKPVVGFGEGVGVGGGFSAPGALSAPVAGGVSATEFPPENKPVQLPYVDFDAPTAWHALAGVGAGGMSAPPCFVPDNRLIPLPDVVVSFDGAMTAGCAVRGGERGMTAPPASLLTQNSRLPTLPLVRCSATPGTPFRWEHAAPSSGVSTTPSDSSLSSASASASLVVSVTPRIAAPFPRIAALFRTRTGPRNPRRRRSQSQSQWALICPLHVVPVAASRHGKSIDHLNNACIFSSSSSSSDGGNDDSKAGIVSVSSSVDVNELSASIVSSSDGGNSSGGGFGGGGEFEGGGGGGGGSYQRRVVGRQRNRQVRKDRRCSHCGTSETPQWRMGPEGPGTLCNACGIRSKMDRLLPEYRPSTSPSFKSDEHSNRHRKVLKLREKKTCN